MPVVPFLDTHRKMPREWICGKLSRFTLNESFQQIAELVSKCYGARESGALLYVLHQLQLSNGTQAASSFLRLRRTEQCFLMFALDIYGLKLVSSRV
jgi:hypothetical protein